MEPWLRKAGRNSGSKIKGVDKTSLPPPFALTGFGWQARDKAPQEFSYKKAPGDAGASEFSEV
jgi:hypothetical protein